MKVEISGPGVQAQSFDVSKKSFTIGRSSEADLVVKIEGMSRVHMRVELEGDQIYITDLNSSNGVFINEERIAAGVKCEYHAFIPLTVCAGAVISFELD